MDEEGGLGELDAMLEDFTSRLEPAQRKKLSMRIAVDLRKANAERIADNEDPDGQPFEPRKKERRLRRKVGRIKRRVKAKKMFLRAGTARFLRRQATSGEARVGYVGAMARIMRVHQLGLRDTVTRDPNSPSAKYPARPVLGMPPKDRLHILEQVGAHLDF